MSQNRIPKLTAASTKAAIDWFEELHRAGLMFHPDDDPADVVDIATGVNTFSKAECERVNKSMARLFASLGDDVYEIAFNTVSATFHTQPERAGFAKAVG